MSIAIATKARIVVADDHGLLATTVVLALREAGFEAWSTGEAASDALVAQVRGFGASLVLLDLDMGDGVPGIHRIGPLRAAGATVVVVTGITDRMTLAAAVEAGAIGWIAKAVPFDDLVAAVARVASGLPILNTTDRAALLAELHAHRGQQERQSAMIAELSPRERLVLGRLMAGRHAEQIAADFVVSLTTVRSQIRSILTKLGVSSQLAAVALARDIGFKPPSHGRP